MPRPQRTDPSSSSNTKKPGSRFIPTDLECVRVHLRNKVEKNKSGFITTLDLYKEDPWLLDHVQNDLFPRGEWYYFTRRNKRGVSSCNRTVRGRGGGTWKITSKKEPIMDKNNKVQGYMQILVYNKTTCVNGDTMPTGWNMKEYCLHKENQDDLVLGHLKGNIKKKGFVEEVKENNLLSNQVQDHHEEEEEAGANRVEMRTLQGDHGDNTQQQKQEQDAPVIALPSPPKAHDPCFETMMAKLEKDLKYQWEDPDFYFSVDELLDGIKEDDVNEVQLQQPVSQARYALGGSAD